MNYSKEFLDELIDYFESDNTTTDGKLKIILAYRKMCLILSKEISKNDIKMQRDIYLELSKNLKSDLIGMKKKLLKDGLLKEVEE